MTSPPRRAKGVQLSRQRGWADADGPGWRALCRRVARDLRFLEAVRFADYDQLVALLRENRTPEWRAIAITRRINLVLRESMSLKMTCSWCDESLTDSDGRGRAVPMHRECSIRAFMGSVGHLRKKCACVGGKEEDPEGLSIRDCARMAVIEAILQKKFDPTGPDFRWTHEILAGMRPSGFASLPKEKQEMIDRILGLD